MDLFSPSPLRVIPLEVRRRIKLTGAELEEFRVREKVKIFSFSPPFL